MYRKTILAVLSLVLLSGFRFTHDWKHADSEGGSDSFAAVAPSKDVFADVSRKIDELPAELVLLKTMEQKISKIRETIMWVDEVRQVTGVQSMSREVSMDYLVDPLRELVKGEPRSDNCSYYKSFINSQYEPSEEGDVSHPSLRRAQRVIASVCP